MLRFGSGVLLCYYYSYFFFFFFFTVLCFFVLLGLRWNQKSKQRSVCKSPDGREITELLQTKRDEKLTRKVALQRLSAQ